MSSEMNLAESAFVHIKAFIKGGGAEIWTKYACPPSCELNSESHLKTPYWYWYKKHFPILSYT
jgi:hypothetical protein